MDKYKARSIVEKEYEWMKWVKEVPSLTFKEDWNVKIIPPFAGAVARFQIKHREDEDTFISVYLDCYNELGCFGEPYWELYPYVCDEYEDVYRVRMNDTQELLEVIDKQLKLQIKNNIITKSKDNPSKFYTYDQNNSGGSFDVDDNVSEYVIIEAKSADHANKIAEDIGIYFDGCSTGDDCSCCGDRWYRAYDDDGKDEPMICSTPVRQYGGSIFKNKVIVYFLNGTKEVINFK